MLSILRAAIPARNLELLRGLSVAPYRVDDQDQDIATIHFDVPSSCATFRDSIALAIKSLDVRESDLRLLREFASHIELDLAVELSEEAYSTNLAVDSAAISWLDSHKISLNVSIYRTDANGKSR